MQIPFLGLLIKHYLKKSSDFVTFFPLLALTDKSTEKQKQNVGRRTSNN